MHGRFSFTRVPVVGAVGIVVSTTVTKNQAAPLCAQLIRRALLHLRKILTNLTYKLTRFTKLVVGNAVARRSSVEQ